MPKNILRLFAGELLFIKRDPKGKRVLPGGDTVKNLYICGVLTEVKTDNKGLVRSARVADPTGVFLINCKKERAYCSSEFLKMDIPSYVSVFGDISTEKRYGREETVINPRSVRQASQKERSLWITGTAASTIERLENSFETSDKDYRQKIIELTESAISVIKNPYSETSGKEDSGENSDKLAEDFEAIPDISGKIIEIITENSTKKGVLITDFYALCESSGIKKDDAQKCVEQLVEDGELYLPSGGYIKIL